MFWRAAVHKRSGHQLAHVYAKQGGGLSPLGFSLHVRMLPLSVRRWLLILSRGLVSLVSKSFAGAPSGDEHHVVLAALRVCTCAYPSGSRVQRLVSCHKLIFWSKQSMRDLLPLE